MASAREIDVNGYLTIRGNPISSFGVFDYSAGQLGLPGDPMRIVKVFRPESAVNNPETLESFRDIPLIIQHAMLSGFADDDEEGVMAPEKKGLDGVLTGNVYYEAPWMRGDIKIFSRKAQKALGLGLKDLSLGYDCRFYAKRGVWEGQEYEYIQDNLIGNHIAMVPEGRVSGARVLDAKIIGTKAFVFDSENGESGHVRVTIEEAIFNPEENMAIKKRTPAMDNAVQQLLSLIPALKTFLEQEATEPAHQEGGAGEGTAVAGEGEVAPAAAAQGEQGAGAAAAQATGESNEDTAAGMGGEGGEGGAAGGSPDIQALITEVETCLAQLKQAVGASAQDEGEMNEGQSGSQTQDSVEGLQEENHNATVATDSANGETAIGGNNGKASPGPQGGINAKAGDSSLRAFYADLAAKTRIYDGLSEVVGAFNHNAMDAREVAAYGVKKLGLKNVKPGTEINAVEIYLQAHAKAAENTASSVRKSVGDSASRYVQPVQGSGNENVDAYIKSLS